MRIASSTAWIAAPQTSTLVGTIERRAQMTALVFSLMAFEAVAYFVLLGQLTAATRARKPSLFAAVGGPEPWDYLMLGFGPGDAFISKLEARRGDLADDPGILRLMTAVRGMYIALLVTACGWLFVVVAGAN